MNFSTIKITIYGGEGPLAWNAPVSFDNFTNANALLCGRAVMLAREGRELGYYKHDFKIEIAEGVEIYRGRYDLNAYGKTTDEGTLSPDLFQHVKNSLRCAVRSNEFLTCWNRSGDKVPSAVHTKYADELRDLIKALEAFN